MSEWKEYKLGEVLSIKYGKDHKRLADGNIPIYGSGGIMRYGEKSLYSGPSILIPRKGSLNNIMYSDKPFWTVDTMFWTIINEDIANPLFVYYAICKRDFASLNVGSAVPSLTVPVIEDINILLPSRKIQDKIVDILSSLDDKIAVNRKINENLEQQAQALFKSWFVDFEPFKDGEFEESELGRIPKGWKVGTLGELSTFKRGKVITKKDVEEGNIPVVAGGMEPAYYHNVANTKSPVITISASGANAGFCRLYYEDVWASDCSYIDSSNKYIYWTYCFLQINKRLLRHAQTGAVQPHVKAGDINSFNIVKPDERYLEEFNKKVTPYFAEIANKTREINTLSQLRDTLLPKLMSGELKVNEI